MTPEREPTPAEEAEFLDFAGAISDDAGMAASRPSEGSSPLWKRLGEVAMTLAAIRGGSEESEAADVPVLFSWGPLRVLRLIGRGSFGEVYAAWDPRLQREVALKLRRADAPGSARRWLDEARALASVRHANVLTVHGADEHEGRAGLWTDLVAGRDLETVLQQQGPFSAREAATIGLELCAALAAVHARGLVHGDVKTRNVMREQGADSPGRIVLMDFGSAHAAELDLTMAQASSAGTPLAMAPEVLRGDPATASTDLYSLGALLFRLVTGRYPVEAATLEALRAKHERGEVASLRSLRPDLPRPFVRAVEQALAPDPRRRFADAAAMERALAERAASPLASPVSRFAAVAVALVIVVVVAWWSRSRVPAPDAGARTPVVAPPTTALSEPRAPAGAAPNEAGHPAVPAPLEVDATFYRSRGGQVTVLASGGDVEPGDRLWLQFESPERVHVYVLDEDQTGETYLLFPMRASDTANPLAPAMPHELPGRQGGEALRWQVTSAGGHETFLVIASRAPIASIQRALGPVREAAEGAAVEYATISPAHLADLRGVGGVVRDSVAPPAGESRLRLLARSLERETAARGLWLRLVEVQNPAR